MQQIVLPRDSGRRRRGAEAEAVGLGLQEQGGPAGSRTLEGRSRAPGRVGRELPCRALGVVRSCLVAWSLDGLWVGALGPRPCHHWGGCALSCSPGGARAPFAAEAGRPAAAVHTGSRPPHAWAGPGLAQEGLPAQRAFCVPRGPVGLQGQPRQLLGSAEGLSSLLPEATGLATGLPLGMGEGSMGLALCAGPSLLVAEGLGALSLPPPWPLQRCWATTVTWVSSRQGPWPALSAPPSTRTGASLAAPGPGQVLGEGSGDGWSWWTPDAPGPCTRTWSRQGS